MVLTPTPNRYPKPDSKSGGLGITVLALLLTGFAGAACIGERSLGSVDASVGTPLDHEQCGNGMDDDQDGLIDEHCPCATTETQACFGGRYPSRLIGRCRDGLQECEPASDGDEFGSWASCQGDTLPAQERCDGRFDDDCDGAVDEGCACDGEMSRACATEFAVGICRPGEQVCGDDGFWSGCIGARGPEPELCSDDLDNDCDGLVNETCDCVPSPEACGDGVDNDCDGRVDEPACRGQCTERATHVVDLIGDQDHMCALIDDGRVYCWGDNTLGSLGLGEGEGPEQVQEDVLVAGGGSVTVTRYFSSLPVPIPGLSGVTSLAVSVLWTTCALNEGTEMVCLGPNPYSTVNPTTLRFPNVDWVVTPQAEAEPLTDLVQVAAGRLANYALDSSGQVWGWGFDFGGIYGNPDMGRWREGDPAIPALLTDVIEIDALYDTVCALRRDATVWCWGTNREGQAGEPGGFMEPPQERPTQIRGIDDATAIAVGIDHSCALRRDGRVFCWGRDGLRGDGIVGNSDFIPVAVPVLGLTDIIAIEASPTATCAVGADGRVHCWGDIASYFPPGQSGGYGSGFTPGISFGTDEISLAVDVAFGGRVFRALPPFSEGLSGNMCILERCGRVRCLGRNPLGQLGDGTTTDSTTLVDVIGLP